jgi:uncharacterized membrane protein YhaH (DUF805 family)
MNIDWRDLLFGFSGRINRAKYWIVVAINFAVLLVGAGLAFFVFPVDYAWLPMLAAGLLTLYVSVAAGIKRLHDRDKTGWWLLLYYVAPGVLEAFAGESFEGVSLLLHLVGYAITIWVLVDLGILRGTVGPNEYGPDPLESRV